MSTNRRNMGTFVINNETKVDGKKENWIYQLNCDTYGAIYIGQTGKNLGIWEEEHINSIKQKPNSTGFAHYLSGVNQSK